MPDKKFTAKQQHFIAAKGGEIAAHMCQEDGADVVGILGRDAAVALDKVRNNTAQPEDITAICAAFFAKTYPVSVYQVTDPQTGANEEREKIEERKLPVMQWIAERYLNDTHNDKQIQIEDLYKIGERVQYFNGLKSTRNLPANDNLEGYESLKALDMRLTPFETKRAAKEVERLARHMPSETRVQIMAETSILYSGKAGQVVVPHTPLASQYWGNGTQWCISGQKYVEIHFSNYNRTAPIVMFLPAKGEKMALVRHNFWDPRDKPHEAPNEEVTALWQDMRAHIGGCALDRLEELRAPEQRSSLKMLLFAPKIKRIVSCDITEKKKYWINKIMEQLDCPTLSVLEGLPEAIKSSKHIFAAAVQVDGRALSLASASVCADPVIVMSAVQQSGWALLYADKVLRLDPAIAMAALQKNCEVSEMIDSQLRETADFARYVLEHGNPELTLQIEALNLSMDGVTEEEISTAQIEAFERLLAEGKDDSATRHARFCRPLWGHGERIFDEPRAQLEFIKAQQKTPAPDWDADALYAQLG